MVIDPRAGRRRSQFVDELITAFKGYAIGDSFFIAGASAREVEFLRRPMQSAGLGITIRQIAKDEIYGIAGVRVWREHGSYDDEL